LLKAAISNIYIEKNKWRYIMELKVEKIIDKMELDVESEAGSCNLDCKRYIQSTKAMAEQYLGNCHVRYDEFINPYW
jgi:hypothetical protein